MPRTSPDTRCFPRRTWLPSSAACRSCRCRPARSWQFSRAPSPTSRQPAASSSLPMAHAARCRGRSSIGSASRPGVSVAPCAIFLRPRSIGSAAANRSERCAAHRSAWRCRNNRRVSPLASTGRRPHGRDCSCNRRHRLCRGLVHRRASAARLRRAHHAAQPVEGEAGARCRRIRRRRGRRSPDILRRRPDERCRLGRGNGRQRLRASCRLAAWRRCIGRSPRAGCAGARRHAARPRRCRQSRRQTRRHDVGRCDRPSAAQLRQGQRRHGVGRSGRSTIRCLQGVQDPRRARAWDFMRDAATSTEFTAILPGAVFGPLLTADNLGSVQIIQRLLQGRPAAMPRLGFWIVDVRDLADLHIRAMISPAAAGQRFIAAGDFMWMSEIAATLRAKLRSRGAKAPSLTLPNFIVRLLLPFMPHLRPLAPLLGRQFGLCRRRRGRCSAFRRVR